ncbi:MAG: hypothetical protein U1E60_06260 [Reyranellaceae bacterium]
MADDVKIIRLVIDSSKAIDGGRDAQKALEQIEKNTESARQSLERLESGFDVGALIAKATSAAYVVKEIADKLLGLFKSAQTAAAAISDFSEQLGVSTRFIQASMFSAAEHTVALDKMGQGYTKVSQTIGQAAQGQKEALDLFERLGVRILDNTGRLRSTEAILQDAATGILRVEEPARRVALAIDVFGKAGTQMIPMLSDLAAGSSVMATKAAAAGAIIEDVAINQLAKLKSQSEESALKWNALVANIGAPIATVAMEAVNRILGDILKNLDRLKQEKVQASYGIPQAGADAQNLQDQLDAQLGLLRINPNNFAAKASAAALQKRLNAAKEAEEVGRQQYATQLLVSGTFPIEKLDPEGSRNPPATAAGGGGETPAQKLAKLSEQLRLTAEAQDRMTTAALAGDQAFDAMKAHVEAQQKTLDLFGSTLDDTDPRLVQIEQTLLRIARGKAAEAFATATTELQKQNVVLEAQLRLLGEAPDVQARELAVIKATQDAKRAGMALDGDAFAARVEAIAQNEKLKLQQEELRKAQELWTEPLKQALRDVQSIAADAFDQLLQSGRFSFESLQQAFSRILRRMAAEFLALATVRPVMSLLVNAVSPGLASQMGFSTAGGAGLLGGAGSGPSLPPSLGGSGLSGWLGDVGQWLNTPFVGGYAGVAPVGAGMFGPAPNTSIASLTNPSTWGITPLGALGAAAGAGLGIYQLISGGGSTASTIGGISSILGAGVSLIPGIGPIAGPIIGLLGNLLPGLFGSEYKLPPLVGASTQWGWNATTGKYGSWDNSQFGGQAPGTYGDLPSRQAALYALLGGVKDPSKVWGNAVWQNYREGQTTAYLIDPSGNSTQWWQGSGNSVPWVEQAGARSAYLSITGGAVGDLSPNLAKVLSGVTPQSIEQLTQVVQSVIDFDKAVANLGKTTSTAEQAVNSINDSLGQMWGFAKANGLDTTAIETFKESQLVDYAKSFMAQFADKSPLQAALDQLDAQKADALKNAGYLKTVLNTRPDLNVATYYIDGNRIEEYFLEQRNALLEQYNAQALSSLQDVIRRLTYGDLSNAAPSDVLSGTRGTYTALLARAQAGDATALAQLGGAASDYAAAGRQYYASSEGYEAIRRQVVADLATVSINIGGDTAASNLGGVTEILAQQIAALTATLAAGANDNAALRTKLDDLADKLNRIVINQG